MRRDKDDERVNEEFHLEMEAISIHLNLNNRAEAAQHQICFPSPTVSSCVPQPHMKPKSPLLAIMGIHLMPPSPNATSWEKNFFRDFMAF